MTVPTRSTVPAGLTDSFDPSAVAQKANPAREAALRELDGIPGHGDNAREVTRAVRADACIQHTPIPGRLFTVTDPDDPLLAKWLFRREKVCYVERDPDGNVVVCKTLPCEVAADRLRKKVAGKAVVAANDKGGK